MNQQHLWFSGLSLAIGFGSFAGACSGSGFDGCVATGTCGSPAETGGAGDESAGAGSSASAGKGAAGGAGAAAGSSGRSAGGNDASDGGADGHAGSATGKGGSTWIKAAGGASGEGGETSAGQAGEGAAGPFEEGGAGGRYLECQRDQDCQDDLHCNGAERCDAGGCRSGAAPCENPDTTHCSVTCEEGVEAAVCVLEAIDGDGDGARSGLCKANRGNDCDDENAAVHPGVTEVCDGVDNDCDGKGDLRDGLSLAGQTTAIAGANELQLAWSEAGGHFFVVYPTGTGMNKATLTTSGVLTADAQPFAVEPTTRVYMAPIIASGEPDLLITHVDAGYIRQGYAPPGDLGYTLTGSGTISGAGRELVAEIKDFAWRSPTEDWVMAQVDDGKIVVNSVSTDLTVKKGPTYDERPSALRIASTGAQSALVWQVKDSSLVIWSRVLQGLDLIGRAELSKNGHQPDITDVDGGYAIAWTTGTGVALARMGTDGELFCQTGVVDLALTAGDGNRVALADSDRGLLALVTSQASNKVSLVRFPSDCQPAETLTVAETPSPGSPSIAVGDGSVALAWSTTSDGGPAYTRVVSDMLCQ